MIDIIKEHLNNISLLINLSTIDLIKTYKNSRFSFLWAIFKPTIKILTYYFMLVIGLKVSKDVLGYPYLIWLILGMIPWFYMNDILYQGSESIRKYSYIVTKMKFPISIIPTFSSLSRFFIHIILIILMILIFILSGYSLNIYILQLPIYMLFTFIFFTVLNQCLSLISSVSKDFLNAIKSSVFVLFSISGVLWDISFIDNPILKTILSLNPITFLINGYRNCFIKNTWFWEEPYNLLFFVFLTIVLIFLAGLCYKKFKKIIPDLL